MRAARTRRCSPSLLAWRALCGLAITSLLATVAGLMPPELVAVAAVPVWVVAGCVLVAGWHDLQDASRGCPGDVAAEVRVSGRRRAAAEGEAEGDEDRQVVHTEAHPGSGGARARSVPGGLPGR